MYRSRKTRKRYNPTKQFKSLTSGEEKCPFCEISSETIVKKTRYHSVIKNIYSYQYWEAMNVLDHLMIVPNRHIETISELNKTEQAALIQLIADYEKQGYNVYAREKANTMKSVPHQHTHLIKTNNKRASLYFHSRRPYLVIKK